MRVGTGAVEFCSQHRHSYLLQVLLIAATGGKTATSYYPAGGKCPEINQKKQLFTLTFLDRYKVQPTAEVRLAAKARLPKIDLKRFP